jgi:hypothetical protein
MAEEVDPNQEQYKKLHFRMYENEFPKENELVYVSINYICNNYLLENSAK